MSPKIQPHNGIKSVSDRFTDSIIERSPAKMINFIEGYIVLAYSDKFLYFKVLDDLDDDSSDSKQVLLDYDQVSYLEL